MITNTSGVATIDVTLNIGTPMGAFAAATATDPNGNTSELSAGILAVVMGPRQVQIDMKPGDSTNSTNLASQVIVVAILSTADFNAALVNVASVRFAGAAGSEFF